ncbi:outer membrane beta-barrel protein [Kaistella sp.]|uniref:outer membrane beta-barrel protein n=1 Tax=Kaistella sp. TaxID=2782235 RepID=UPI003C3B2787
MTKKISSAVIALLFSQLYFSQEKTNSSIKEKQIEEVTITKTKKAVEQKADRTIYDFSEQAHLNSGTTMDGLKKIPGLVVSEMAGMIYQGKSLEVYMDGRPLNLYSDQLTAYLEGLPANSIERVEMITQPGAEFPATSGGAIINIITSRSAKSYLSATYAGGYRFSNYDKFRNKFNNSLTLNSRNKWFGWQLNVGQSYNESEMKSTIDEISKLGNDNIARNQFLRSALTFDLGKDRLLLNYNLSYNNTDRYIDSYALFEGTEIISNDQTTSDNTRNEVVATYQKKFDDRSKKFEVKASYSNNNAGFKQNSHGILPIEIISNSANGSSQDVYNLRVDYAQPIKILDEGKFGVGGDYNQQNFVTNDNIIDNLDYRSKTSAVYSEINAKKNKFDFVFGLRGEYYNIGGTSYDYKNSKYDALTTFDKFKVFPNASVQYNFVPNMVFANINYNKKISLPSISNLNPNNTRYGNSMIDFSGNPNLQPTIFDNFEVKISAMNFAFIGYSLSSAKNQVVQEVSRVGDRISQSSVNVDHLKIHSFNLGVPIPFAIFSKPISEIIKMDVNPDKMNFLYFYTSYEIQELDKIVNPKGYWTYNVSGQFLLPSQVKLNLNYTYLGKGNYYYFYPNKSLYNTFNVNLSRKFDKDRMTLTLFANDIFNTNETNLKTISSVPHVFIRNKSDSRSFGLSFSYKIPTKNKLAKVDQNILNTETPKEDNGGLMNQK